MKSIKTYSKDPVEELPSNLLQASPFSPACCGVGVGQGGAAQRPARSRAGAGSPSSGHSAQVVAPGPRPQDPAQTLWIVPGHLWGKCRTAPGGGATPGVRYAAAAVRVALEGFFYFRGLRERGEPKCPVPASPQPPPAGWRNRYWGGGTQWEYP